jgi:YVTN family beta-propeller protein
MSRQAQNEYRPGVCGGFVAVGVALLSVVLWTGRPVRAAVQPETSTSADYASPIEVLLSPDGARLYVLCQQSDGVRVLNAVSFAVIKNIAVGRVPRGLSLSPKGDKLFVTNAWDDTISVIDTEALEVIHTWPVGAEPSSVLENLSEKHLFVANRISNDIAVLDAQTGVEEKRLVAGRGASYLALSPDGSRIYVTHVYPKIVPRRTGLENRLPPESEITVIDAERAVVVDRVPLPAIAGVFHVALSADGHLGVAAEYHPRNLLPLAHVEHGGAFTYSLELFGADVGKTPVEVPLDELNRYASQPFGVAIMPDKSRIYVTCGGSEIVTVIDVPRLLRFIHTHNGPFAQDLSASANYVVTRIPVGLNPRGLAFSRDGRRLFVANRLNDTVSVIDTRINRVASTITLTGSTTSPSPLPREDDLTIASSVVDGKSTCSKCHGDGRTQSQYAPTPEDLQNLVDEHKERMVPSLASSGSKTISPLRRGEEIFYTSRFSFQGQIGCASCHIDSTFDGVQWNLEPDGFGRNTVDNKLLEGIVDTEPYKWTGTNPNIPTECGPRTEKYFWRSENYDERMLTDLAVYVRSLAPRPNRWRQANGELTSAQERGKVLFERAVDKFKKPIPESNRCSSCHSGPKGTNQNIFDVGTRKPNDNTGLLKAPMLTNIALTAPYLHDGSARSLEEIWTIYNQDDKHGRTNDLTKDELNDLIEYLRTR